MAFNIEILSLIHRYFHVKISNDFHSELDSQHTQCYVRGIESPHFSLISHIKRIFQSEKYFCNNFYIMEQITTSLLSRRQHQKPLHAKCQLLSMLLILVISISCHIVYYYQSYYTIHYNQFRRNHPACVAFLQYFLRKKIDLNNRWQHFRSNIWCVTDYVLIILG